MFKGCTALTEASLPRSMKKFGRWNFFGTAIRSLDLGRIDYWDGRIIGGMTNLVELKFDSFNDDFVCEGDMVLNKDKTRLLFLPSTRSELKLPKSVTTLDTWAMCRADVTIPRQIRRVEQMAFGNCHALRSVRFESPDVSIGHHAFLHAENLRHVDFPEGMREVDSCKVFSSCSSLREIRFPRSLRKLGAELFSNCSSLRKVAFDGDAPALVDDGRYRGVNIFIGTPRDLVVTVKRGSRGWNPGDEGLPKVWPVGAGENARTIRYADEDVGPNADKKTFDPEKLKDPNSTRTVQKALDRELQDARVSRQDKGPRYTEEGLLEQPVFDAARFADRDSTRRVQKTLDALFPGWKTTKNAEKAVHPNEEIGYISDIRGRHDVLATLPPSRQSPVRLTRTMVVPEGAKLSLAVRKNPTAGGGLMLEVYANGKRRWEGVVTDGEWFEHAVDLSDLAGKRVRLEVRHMIHPDFGNARALWSDLSVR